MRVDLQVGRTQPTPLETVNIEAITEAVIIRMCIEAMADENI